MTGMSYSHRGRFGVLIAAGLALAACGSDHGHASPVASDAQPYERPAGWHTACIGRWLVDLPGEVDFGEGKRIAGAEKNDYATDAMRAKKERGSFVIVAGVKVAETAPLSGPEVFDDEFKEAFDNGYGYIKNNTSSMKRAALLRLVVGQVATQGIPHSVAWKADEQFDVSIYDPRDSRARTFWADTRSDPPTDDGDAEGARRAEQQARLIIDEWWPRVRPRKTYQLPAEPGLCLPHGFIADPAHGTERDVYFSMIHQGKAGKHDSIWLQIRTRTPKGELGGYSTLQPRHEDIQQEPTFWEQHQQTNQEERERCKNQRTGTASRMTFGCFFAGVSSVKGNRPESYFTLQDGQKARLSNVQFDGALLSGDGKAPDGFSVTVETGGNLGDPAKPVITITTGGDLLKSEDREAAMGRVEQVATNVARSIRLRPGAIDPKRPVIDSLAAAR